MDNLFNYQTDEVIFKEHSQTCGFYLVKSGAVVLYLNYGKANEHLLGVVSAGKVFGENGLAMNGENIYTAVALGDTTVIRIARSDFREFIINHPECVAGIVNNLTIINTLLRDNIDLLLEEHMSIEKRLQYVEQINTEIVKKSLKETYKNSLQDSDK